MIDLTKVKLPDYIDVDGKFFYIRTDFRSWLNFSRIVNTKGAVVDDVDFIYRDEIPPAENKKQAFTKLLEFFRPKNELPRPVSEGEGESEKVLDYELDADLIYCAFREQYKIDLLETDSSGHVIEIHWHIFLALLDGLHGTKLNSVMEWRSWTGETKTEYGKHMSRLRRAWELPTKESEQVQKDLDAFNSLFKK